ncbi:uncharacterized protein [Erythrolamprus reginae]|uniref:uncharacterized protein n=1 Tax=Erythrolamprus reginae TaxID=121349 RepID=UPI00396C5FE9
MSTPSIIQPPELFDPERSTWTAYMAKFDIFLEAAGMHDAEDSRKRALFLNYCGSQIFELAGTLTDPEPANSVPWDTLKEKLASHFKPTKPARVYRHQFSRTAQAEGESINQFATRLRTILAKCQFENPEARLTDAIIFGMRNVTIRNKLLAAEESTLQDVIKAAQTAEVAEAAAADLKSNDKLPTVSKISDSHRSLMTRPYDYQLHEQDQFDDYCCQIRGPTARQLRPPYQPCAGCHGQHPRSRCPFKDAICRRCDKRGHIAPACRAIISDDFSASPHLLPPFPAQRFPRPPGQFNRGNRRPWNPRGSYNRLSRNRAETEQIDWDLPGQTAPSSAAPSVQHASRGDSYPSGQEEPSSSVDSQVFQEPRRSDRTPRRPARLNDYITYLSE